MKKLFAIAFTLVMLSACKSGMGGSGDWLNGDRSSTMGDQRNAVNVVYFDFDKSSLHDEDKDKIAKQAEMWKASSKPMLIVEGHCDKVGNAEYNLALGNRRAHEAKRELVKHGVPADKIETISYGSERPAVMDDDSLNRRAVTIGEKK